MIFAGLATLTGGDAGAVESAQRLGEQVGRGPIRKSSNWKLMRWAPSSPIVLSYDPLRGAEFFTRIPDPGNRFLGTHPPNAARLETVRRTAAAL